MDNMNIYARENHKVCFSRPIVGNSKINNKYLEYGKVYTVQHTTVLPDKSFVRLKEKPDMEFSTVHFTDVTYQCIRTDQEHDDFERFQKHYKRYLLREFENLDLKTAFKSIKTVYEKALEDLRSFCVPENSSEDLDIKTKKYCKTNCLEYNIYHFLTGKNTLSPKHLYLYQLFEISYEYKTDNFETPFSLNYNYLLTIQSFQKRIDFVSKYIIIEMLSENDFSVNLLDNGEIEIETWTEKGVNMIMCVEPTLKEIEKHFSDFDIDEEIDLHRKDEKYKKDFSIAMSLVDFTDFKKRLTDFVRKLTIQLDSPNSDYVFVSFV